MENKQSILVIDDSPTVRKLAELVLSKEGYIVYTAEDGDEGFQLAKKEAPSVIIVDFIMPKMNGYDFCKNVGSDPLLKNIPIILITSKGKQVGQGFDKKFGIVTYLQKPFEAETLITTVTEALASRKEESGAAPEEVREHAAVDMKVDMASDDRAAETPPSHVDMEVNTASDDHAVETPPSHAPSMANAGSAPAETPSAENGPIVPVYAALQESIEKEFRHYFGRELTVLLKNTMIQSLKETDLVRSSRRILSGEIMYISVDDVMKFISMSGLSGKLSVLTNNFNSEIYLESGQIAFASISRPNYRTCLEELILRDGNPRKSEILSALSEAGGNNLTAGGILLDRGLITENELTDYYRRLSEDAVEQTLSAASGHFYIEDVPLPKEIQGIKLGISLNGARG